MESTEGQAPANNRAHHRSGPAGNVTQGAWRLPFASAALALVLCSLSPNAAFAQLDRRTFDEARLAFNGCAALFGDERFPSWPLDDDGYQVLRAHRVGARWLVSEDSFGNGVDAEHGGQTLLFDPSDCSLVVSSWGMSDGDFLMEAQVRVVRGAPPSPEDVAALTLATSAQPDAPEHGVARAWLQHTCPRDENLAWPHTSTTWDVFGPLARAQPWLPGLPRAAPSTYWTEAQLRALAASDLPRSLDDRTGVIVPSVPAARRVWSGEGYEIWAAVLSGRNAGEALAIVDPRHRRHRWVLLTRGCVDGTRTRWIASGRGMVVGQTESRHPVYEDNEAVVAIELAEGRAWVASLPSEELDRTHAAVARGGVRLRTRSGSVVATFAALRSRIEARLRGPSAPDER